MINLLVRQATGVVLTRCLAEVFFFGALWADGGLDII